MLGRREDAEDAVQTAFLRLYRSINKFAFKSRLGTYLFRIMMNVCFDILRKRKPVHAQAAVSEDSAHVPGEDLHLQLEEAIAALPERMRACFVLFAVEELKQNEIAEILGLSVGAVKSHIFHAKTKLRAVLADVPAKV